MMEWLVNNWSLLVVLICGAVVVTTYVKRFYNMPTEDQIHKVKEWLLFAVMMAERDLGEGTGVLKLRYVYDAFVERFPAIAKVIPFAIFASWVDEALDEMRKILETNKDVEAYIEGNE